MTGARRRPETLPPLPPSERIRGLPPVAAPGVTCLILGTLPGEESLRRRQYYANPRNHFWRIAAVWTGTEPDAPYGQRTAALKKIGIALWDVAETSHRRGSRDDSIRSVEPNDLAALLREFPTIRHIFLNGRKAAQFFDRHVRLQLLERHPGLPIEPLPSTSPAYAAMGLGEKTRRWDAVRRCALAPRMGAPPERTGA